MTAPTNAPAPNVDVPALLRRAAIQCASANRYPADDAAQLEALAADAQKYREAKARMLVTWSERDSQAALKSERALLARIRGEGVT